MWGRWESNPHVQRTEVFKTAMATISSLPHAMFLDYVFYR